MKLSELHFDASQKENQWIIMCQKINLAAILIFPAVYIYYRQPNPVGAFIAVCSYSITFLKLFSYMHINYRCRQALIQKKTGMTRRIVLCLYLDLFRFSCEIPDVIRSSCLSE